MIRVAVLDDWQGIARSSADWSALEARTEVVIFEDALDDEDALVERLRDFDILMTMRERTRFPASLIARLPKLRMLNITGARNPSVDAAALAARGVVISRTESGENGEATSELTLLLMLSAARRLPAGDAAMRRGAFQNGIPMGRTLRGKTLGLIGLGRLGNTVAGYAQALGMRVIAWSPNLTIERAEAAGVGIAGKDELLAEADFVSLHLVLAPSTRGILGARELGLMKPGAVLINTSRGPLVDEAALVEKLKTGALVAALDVYDREPMASDHPLLTTPNTILSPHLGYCVEQNFAVFHRQGIENVLAFLDGAPIRPLPSPT